MRRLTIIGLGLIGGSLGLALRRARVDYRIVGHDMDPARARLAQSLGAIDRAEFNLPAAVEQSHLVILAVPPRTMAGVFQQISPYVSGGTVVTDTASTKVEVMSWASQYLPPGVEFIGGHPMAGREQSGIAAAQSDLYRGSAYCIVPAAGVRQSSIETVTALAKTVGATPLFTTAEEHDSYVAAVSHLPFLMSIALTRMVSDSPAWPDLGRLAAGGFRDVSRLASGSPEMHADICLTNKQPISEWLGCLRNQLDEIEQLIDSDWANLRTAFAEAKHARDEWLDEPARTYPRPIHPPTSRRTLLARLVLGGLAAGRLRVSKRLRTRRSKQRIR